jgi:hypothetical protein
MRELEAGATVSPSGRGKFTITAEQRKCWSFQPAPSWV